MQSNEARSTATVGKHDASGNNETINLAKTAKFLELSSTSTASNDESSLPSLGSQLSTDVCPFDEEVKETRPVNDENTPPVGATIRTTNDKAGPSVQTDPKDSGGECNDTIEQEVSKLLGEMAMILDESICSPAQTPPEYRRRQEPSSDSPLSTSPAPSPSSTGSAPNYPKVPVKPSLLRQMACINSDLRDGSTQATGDDDVALVGGNILIETIERLLAERTEMIREVLALLEATREETSALRDIPRYYVGARPGAS